MGLRGKAVGLRLSCPPMIARLPRIMQDWGTCLSRGLLGRVGSPNLIIASSTKPYFSGDRNWRRPMVLVKGEVEMTEKPVEDRDGTIALIRDR